MQLRTIISALLVLFFLAGCIEEKPDRLAKRESPVSAELKGMVAEQERALQTGTIAPGEFQQMQQENRRAVYRLISQALIREPEDLYRAALLLASPDTTVGAETFLQAHFLAGQAARKGYQDAKYLTANSLDRYLVLSELPQAYGTQYYLAADKQYRLYPFDSLTTDSDRVAWDVPPLDSLKARIQALNSGQVVDR